MNQLSVFSTDVTLPENDFPSQGKVCWSFILLYDDICGFLVPANWSERSMCYAIGNVVSTINSFFALSLSLYLTLFTFLLEGVVLGIGCIGC